MRLLNFRNRSCSSPSIQVEHLLQVEHGLGGAGAAEGFEGGGHECLPLQVDLFPGHAVESGLEAIRGFKVTEQQAVVA